MGRVTYKEYVQRNQNFRICDKAYTEDYVYICNIFVYKIPNKTTVEELKEFFKLFGEVDKVHWVGKKTSPKSKAPKNAFVYFYDAFAAAEVLKHPSYTFQKTNIFVKACDSWHQPQKRGNFDYDDDGDRSSRMNILQLNDDCLEIICKKLRNIRHQIYFARTCKRFRNIFQMVSKLKYKVFEINESIRLTLWEYRDFFKFSGQYIKNLTLFNLINEKQRVLKFAAEFCTNVENLKLSEMPIKSSDMNLLLKRMKKITKLELNNCQIKANGTLALKKLTKLETLSLCKISSITGYRLTTLKTIRHLSITDCDNFEERFLIELLQSQQNLTSLLLVKPHPTQFTRRMDIVKSLSNLETLQTNRLITEDLALMPKLKNLEMHGGNHCRTIIDRLMIQLAELRAEQLESFNLNWLNYGNAQLLTRFRKLKRLSSPGNLLLNDDYLRIFGEIEQLEYLNISKCQLISNSGLLELLRKLLNLKIIQIQGCKTITDEFVYEAIKLLKKNSPRHNDSKPLLCYALDSNISRNILRRRLYIRGQSYIKVIFTNERYYS